MSQTKAQLIGAVGVSTVRDLSVYGGVNATGIVTATGFVGDGSGLTGAGSTVADDTATNGTFYPVFTQTTSGTITASKVSTSKLSFNPSTGTLSATNVSIAGTLTYEDVTNIDSIGIVTARAGIVLGPTANTIQLGTGTTISSPSSDEFTILTNGSERVRVSSAGSFGINQTNPGATLDVSGNIRLSAVDPNIEFNNGGAMVYGPAGNTLAFATGGGPGAPQEKMRIDSSGNVGIGSDTPRARLDTGTGAFISKKPADFWGDADYYDIGNYGAFTTQGSYEISITCNGYRTSSNVWKSLNVNGNTGACSIEFNPAGTIQFGTESNKADGSSSSVTERARFSNTGGFSVGTTANPGAGAIYATGDITAFYSSDIRLKKDIEPISEPIKKLMEISGVTYKWNEEYLKDKEVDGYFVRETEVGVIAQEVEKVLPEVVATRENGYKAVRYEKLVALLIEAVKDQQKQIDELRTKLEEK